MSPGDSKRQQVDWETCTFEGAEREQLRIWSRLPLRQKLLAVEEMCDLARKSVDWRISQGLPYIDPATGDLVKPPLPLIGP